MRKWIKSIPLPRDPSEFPRVQNWLTGPLRSKGIDVCYYPGTALGSRDIEETGGNMIAKKMRVAMKLEQRDKDPGKFSWFVMTDGSKKRLPMAVQRQRLKHDWEHAMQKSLKARGLRSDGRRRNGTEPVLSLAGGGSIPELYGTMQILIHQGIGWLQPIENISKYTDEILRQLIKGGLATKPTKR